jgi:hypothetical protein
MPLINKKFHENPLKLLNAVDGQTGVAELMAAILQHYVQNMQKCCKMAAVFIRERLNKLDDYIYIAEPCLTNTLFTYNILCNVDMINELHKIWDISVSCIYINVYVSQFPLYYFLMYQSYRLRVFENRLLRRIFALKRDEMTVGWRKLHNEEFHNLYSSRSIIRMIMSRRIR